MNPSILHSTRLQQLKRRLLETNIDAAFIVKKEHIFYLTGLASLHPIEREAYLIVTPSVVVLYHSPFITPPVAYRKRTAAREQPSFLSIPMSREHPISQVFQQYVTGVDQLGIEKLNLTVSELERIQTIMPGLTILPIDDVLMKLRLIKDRDELRTMGKASRITASVMTWAKRFTRTKRAIGITELALSRLIEQRFLEEGADNTAFPTIVAFGAHTASPHHVPGSTKLQPNSIVLVDMGAKYREYLSDMTRTWTVGPPPPQFSVLASVVKKAYQVALEALTQPNPTAAKVDAAARNVINKAGWGNYFIHTTGHGIGLEAHEAPSLSETNEDALQPNMTITIEPGIYLPNKFGYRFENTLKISLDGRSRMLRPDCFS